MKCGRCGSERLVTRLRDGEEVCAVCLTRHDGGGPGKPTGGRPKRDASRVDVVAGRRAA